jgi:hypothetical protein
LWIQRLDSLPRLHILNQIRTSKATEDEAELLLGAWQVFYAPVEVSARVFHLIGRGMPTYQQFKTLESVP